MLRLTRGAVRSRIRALQLIRYHAISAPDGYRDQVRSLTPDADAQNRGGVASRGGLRLQPCTSQEARNRTATQGQVEGANLGGRAWSHPLRWSPLCYSQVVRVSPFRQEIGPVTTTQGVGAGTTIASSVPS